MVRISETPTVTPNLARIKTMQQTIIDLHGQAGSPFFLFNPIPVLGMDRAGQADCETLLKRPWMRANWSDLFLEETKFL